MAKDMRAKDATIKDLAERLSETAEAAEAAASAAHIMDKERKSVRNEIAKLRKDVDEKLHSSSLQVSFHLSVCLWGINLKEEKRQYMPIAFCILIGILVRRKHYQNTL